MVQDMRSSRLNDSVFFLMGTAYRKFRNQAQLKLNQEFAITTEMLKALEVLGHFNELSQRELAIALMLEKSSAKRLVDNLIKRELVKVVPHSTNKRARLLSLTSTGVKIREAGSNYMIEQEKQWLERIGSQESQSLKRALNKLLQTSS